jgi:SAM-dependent methyltransferase
MADDCNHDERQKPDGGRTIDWGHTSHDYSQYRPGPPDSFYEVLRGLGLGLAGQRILDLGTGTGALARRFATQGCRVTGVDISQEQIAAARNLARSSALEIDFRVAPAEQTGLPEAAFDVITACQSWLYFKKPAACIEARRLLAPGGRLLTAHLCWLPRLDPLAQASEELVLRFNPAWTGADFSGDIPTSLPWSKDFFRVSAMFFYDEPIEFTRDQWRGRIRACRGIGASLSKDEVARFDSEHQTLLDRTVPDRFSVLHRIDCHVLSPFSPSSSNRLHD